MRVVLSQHTNCTRHRNVSFQRAKRTAAAASLSLRVSSRQFFFLSFLQRFASFFPSSSFLSLFYPFFISSLTYFSAIPRVQVTLLVYTAESRETACRVCPDISLPWREKLVANTNYYTCRVGFQTDVVATVIKFRPIDAFEILHFRSLCKSVKAIRTFELRGVEQFLKFPCDNLYRWLWKKVRLHT